MTLENATPAIAIPREFSTDRRSRRRWRFFMTVLTACTLFAFVAMILAARPPIVDWPDEPRNQWIADAAVSSYVQGQEQQVPFGTGVLSQTGLTGGSFSLGAIPGLDSVSLIESRILENGPIENRTEIYSYAVVDNKGVFRVDVTIIETDNGPILGAPLAMMEYPQTETNRSVHLRQSQRSGARDAKLDLEPVQAQLNRWARAFLGDDRQQLTNLSGDTGPGIYTGVGGFELIGEVGIVGIHRFEGRVVAQVSFTAESISDPDSRYGLAYDVLLNPDGQFPKITAWGSLGSGAGLQPFENSVLFLEEIGDPGDLAPEEITDLLEEDRGEVDPNVDTEPTDEPSDG